MDGGIIVPPHKDKVTVTFKKARSGESVFAYQEWSASLAAQMAIDSADYLELSDTDLKRNKSAAMMARLLMHIQRLPEVDNQVWYPLKDMLHFFSDLDIGVRHPWLTSNKFGGNFKSSAEAELYEWIVIALEILFDGGYAKHGQKKVAYGLFHISLAESGREINLATIKAEHHNFKNGWHRAQERIERTLSQYWFSTSPCPGGPKAVARCIHGQKVYGCDTGKDGRCANIRKSAENQVEVIFKHHSFRDCL